MLITRKKTMNNGILKSIVEGRCPKCRQAKMFKYPAYSFSKGSFALMNKNCENCNYRFAIEPGFFIGASYVNYAFFIVILLSTYFSGRIIFNAIDPVVIFFVVLGIVLVLFPVLFRYSRIIYSYLFSGVKYDAEAGKT